MRTLFGLVLFAAYIALFGVLIWSGPVNSLEDKVIKLVVLPGGGI